MCGDARCRRSTLVTNRSSPTSWMRSPQALGQQLPALPVLFGHAVLDRDDRVPFAQLDPVLAQLDGGQHAPLPLEVVRAVAPELGRRGVERQGDVRPAGTRLLDRIDDHVERLPVAFEVRGKAALVADPGAEPRAYAGRA